METIFRMNNLQSGKRTYKKVFNTLGHKEPDLIDTDVMIKTNRTKINLFIQ